MYPSVVSSVLLFFLSSLNLASFPLNAEKHIDTRLLHLPQFALAQIESEGYPLPSSYYAIVLLYDEYAYLPDIVVPGGFLICTSFGSFCKPLQNSR